jgi:hypothetical protein
VKRRRETPGEHLEWPERWPVLAPLAGVATALGGAAVAVTEGDWVATTVFLVPAAVLAVVARRNAEVCRASDRGDRTP